LIEKAAEKAKRMFEAGCAISEFGTRRRRSWKIQDMIVDTLKKTSELMNGRGKLTGTSNVIKWSPIAEGDWLMTFRSTSQ
jgi:nicotinate phosphoribosyltransferase